MSDALTVPTHFGDISELAEGLVDRVDDDRLILYGPQPYDDGAEIPFSVLLADGSPALQGVGRVATSVDGGEERPEEIRYDVVLDSLQLDGSAQVVFERMLMARQSMEAGGPETGEVSVDQVHDVEQSVGDEEESTMVAEVPDMGRRDAEPAEPQAAEPVEPQAAEPQVAEPQVAEPQVAEPQQPAEPVQQGAEMDFQGWDEPVAEPAPEAGAAPEPIPGTQPIPDQGAAPDFDASDEATAVAPHGYQAEYDAAIDEGGAEPQPLPHEPAPPAEAGDVTGEEQMPESFDSGTGEVSLAEMDDVGEPPTQAEPAPEPVAAEGGATGEVSLAEMDDVQAPVEAEGPVEPLAQKVSVPPVKQAPAPPQEPPGFAVHPMGSNGSALTRPSYGQTWTPTATPRPEPQPSSGLFDYSGGIPIPERPPRPDLDPSVRVGPAPRPAAGGAPAGGEPVDAGEVASPPPSQPQQQAGGTPDWSGFEEFGEAPTGESHDFADAPTDETSQMASDDAAEVDLAEVEEASSDEATPSEVELPEETDADIDNPPDHS